MSLVLVGFRGSGKSVVARHLAQHTGWESIDSDVEIEHRAGKSIREIFEDTGEDGFRQLEMEVLAELVPRKSTVIAAGGGIVVRKENRALLQQAEHVVWLRASPQVLAQRIAEDPTTAGRRPALTKLGSLPEIERLLDQRTPWYSSCADLEIDTEKAPPDQVALTISKRLGLPSRD